MASKKQRKKDSAASGVTPAKPFHSGEVGLSRRYQLLVSVLLLIAAICVLYPELVFENKVFVAPDAEAASSYATPIQKAMRSGDAYPLWNPYLFSGMPSYGSLSYNPYVYPVNTITTFLVKYLRFPNVTWLLFHIFLLGLGVTLLLMDRKIHFLIATAAGVLMMWMPNHVAVGSHGHGSQAVAVAYIPFALLFWDRIWRGKGVLLNASALAILLGFQLLRAHLQICFYTFSLLGMHFLFFGVMKVRDAFSGRADGEYGWIFRFSGGGDRNPKRSAFIEIGTMAGVLAVVVVAALLMSAVLFVPVQDYAKYSIRGASEGGGLDYDYATSWSLHPSEMLTFLIPSSFGFGKNTYYGHMPFTDYPNYLGIIAVAMALIAVVIVKARFARFLAFVIIVSTLVAFGKHLPVLYGPLFKLMPYFNKFRVPVMALIVQQLAFALMFGLGLSALLKADPDKGRRYALYGAGVGVLLLLVVLLTHNYWTNGFAQSIAKNIRNVRSVQEQLALARMAGDFLFKDLFKLSLLLTVASGLLFMYYRRVLAVVPLVLALTAVALIDIYLVDRNILHPEKMLGIEQYRIIKDKSVRDRFLQPDGVVNFLKLDQRHYRVFPMRHPSSALTGDFESNRYMNFGISSIGGYHAAKLAIYRDFIDGLGTALSSGNFQPVDMLNTRYLIAGSPLRENPVFKPVWNGTDYRGRETVIYENARAMPRVFFADQYQVAPGKQSLERLVGGEVDITKTVLLESEPGLEPVSAEGAEATITQHGLNEIRVDARLNSAAILVLSEIFYPRWEVSIDGEPGEMIKANYILRAVALAAGDHEVVFRYDASLLRKSFALSIVSFSIALVVLVVSGLLSVRGGMKWKHSS